MNNLGYTVNPRVNQLDASLLDSELVDQLKSKLLDAFKLWDSDFREKYEQEIQLLLKALLFKVTIWDQATTYGAKLQNLVIVKTSTGRPIGAKTKALYGLITILLPYGWYKLQENGLLSVQILDRVSMVWNTASLFNFVAFLFSGNYLTVVLRLLGARFAAVSRSTIRNVNYEFQNRQLIWNALTEFLLFALPLINYRKMLRQLRELQKSVRPANGKGPLSSLPRRLCAICYEQDPAIAAKGITNPYTAGCEHPYCYVCLSLRLAEDSDWECLKCTKRLSQKEMAPFGHS